MIGALLADFLPLIVSGLTLLGVAFGLVKYGEKKSDTKHETRKAKADAKTHKRIDNRDPVDPIDRPNIVDRLRKHQQS